MSVSSGRAVWLLCAACLTAAAAAAAAEASPEKYDCDQHREPRDPAGMRGCLPRLDKEPEAFVDCKKQLCYIFLREPPFVILDDVVDADENLVFDPKASPADQLQHQRLFNCSNPHAAFPGLKGIAFNLHASVSDGALCVWGGDTCTFNNLVDYTNWKAKDDYQFGISGLLLETEERHCFHEFGSPIVDNSMVIIGENSRDNSPSKSSIAQLHEPFQGATWAIFGGTILAFVVACVAIATRFSLRGRSLITGFFIFVGERNGAIAHESEIHPNMNSKNDILGPGRWKSRKTLSFETKYSMAMALFRIALLVFIGIFCLFYEVAVVNFIFQQQTLNIGKSVTQLTRAELEKYSVLKDSALEQVWIRTVNPHGDIFDLSNPADYPWRRCQSASECIAWTQDLNNDRTTFDLTIEIMGKYLIDKESDCNHLAIFETEDALYSFNAGWLYNSQVKDETRRAIDRETVKLRINGVIRKEVETYIEDFSCTATQKTDIGPMIVLLPIMIFVFPPLLFAVLAVLCWKGPEIREQAQISRQNENLQGGGDSAVSSS